MHRSQNLDRTFRIRNRSLTQRCFISAALPFAVPRTRIPGGRDHALIVVNLLVSDLYPMSQRSSRSLVESPALRLFRPGVWIPLFAVMDSQIAVPQFVAKLCYPLRDLPGHDFCFDCSSSDAS